MIPVFTDAETIRKKIHSKLEDALKASMKIDLQGRTLELVDVHHNMKEYSPEDQKRALLSGSTLQTPIKGTLVLKDKSGVELDRATNFTLVHVPYLTERHTLIADGNEYQVANQLRRKPGVYTQRAENGELRTVFNLGKGKNFDLGFNEQKGTFYLQYGTSNLPLYPILRGMGVSHNEIASHLGAGVAKENETEHGHQVDQTVNKLYKHLEHPAVYDANAPQQQKVEAIRKRYETTVLDPEVTSQTLGHSFTKVTPEVLLTSAKKLLAVHKGQQDVDDTDSLAFKTFHALDDFLAERVRLTARQWGQKAKLAMRGKTAIREGIRPAPFSDSIRKFVTTSSLTAVPTGINPLELMDHAAKVTALGEGGIPSDRAIPLDARMTHSTHFGAIDGVRTVECFLPETEVLTSVGWVQWKTVNERTKFACKIAGRLEFHRASRVIAEPYKGPLFGVKTSKIEYWVTPNHRIWSTTKNEVSPKNKRAPKFEFELADKVHGKALVLDTVPGIYAGNDKQTHFQLPIVDGTPDVGPIDINLWSEFMGWFLSEGGLCHHKGKLRCITISQSSTANPVKYVLIEEMLKKLPFSYSKSADEFTISNKQLRTYLKQFGFCYDKFIPAHLFTAPREAREQFLNALLLGDGRTFVRRNGKVLRQKVLCTTSPRLARDTEQLAASLGYPTKVGKYVDKRHEHYLDMYEVRLMKTRFRPVKPEEHRVDFHNGMIHCATVPGGLLYVRHGNSIGHWSGNSNHAGVDVRATISAHRDDKGNLYTEIHDVKQNKVVKLPAGEIRKHVVAFAHQPLTGDVEAFVNGVVKLVPAKDVTHQMIHDSYQYSPATTMLPMIRNMQGNRAIMASKMGTQALPLVHREAPFVQNMSHLGPDISFETVYGHMTCPRSPVDGTIKKIENGYIYIKPHNKQAAKGDEDLVKVPYQQNFPFPSKTFLHHNLEVRKGEEVRAGQRLGDSNFTKNGTMALGANLRIAYIPYYGFNSNDAVVISESCAKKLTSAHMYREVYPINAQIELSKNKHQIYYGSKYTPQQYGKLDEHGVIRAGTKVDPKDPLVLGLTKVQLQGNDLLLGKISKSLTKPYRDIALTWEHGTRGEVVEVHRSPTQISILVKTLEQMQVGDKLCYDEETDILTDNGWKPVADVSLQDRVATLHDGELKYEQPKAVHMYPEGGRMYRLVSDQVDLFVTEKHKMYVKQRGSETFDLIAAKDIFGKRVQYCKHATWDGETPDFVTLPPLEVKAGQFGRGKRVIPGLAIPTKTYAMLLGMFISEGHTFKQEGGNYGIEITQIKEPNRSQMLEALRTSGFKFNAVCNGTKVRIYSKQIYEHFKAFGKSYEKYLPGFVFNWAIAEQKELFSWLMWGDGHADSANGRPISYTTTSKRLSDDVQRLALHIGYAANIKSRHKPVQTIKGKSYDCRKRYDVRIVVRKLEPTINHGHTKTQHGQKESWVENYAKPVFCVTVSTGIIYVRRNGKSVFSGNSGRHGNKGVVSKILPDHEMLRNEKGDPMDLLMTSAGVVSRVNPSQITETLLGKLVEKTGKPVIYNNNEHKNTVEYAESKLREHGLKGKETLYDPILKRHIKGVDDQGVFTGRQYIYKLFKSTSTNFAGHGVGPYDVNLQPLKTGGDDSAKGLGKMEFDALIAHNARNLLQEAAVVKSTKNDEFWKALQTGMPLPHPKTTFAFNKFTNMLEGAGIKVDKNDSKFRLLPLTDKDVSARSAGVIENKKTLIAKSLKPEKGGLFDPVRTGGPQGTLYSHINLNEPIPHPVFVEPIRRLLGLTQKEFDVHVQEKGGAWFKSELSKLDVEKKLVELREKLKRTSNADLDNVVKQIKYLEALKANKMRPEDAYVISKVPVIPPVFRPIIPMPNDPSQLMISDANKLYGHLLDTNDVLKNTALDSDKGAHRKMVFRAVGAVFGTHDTDDEKLNKQGVKGFLQNISGVGTPKAGFFQRKLMRRTQDVSGRGTIVPDPTLGMDEVGIPEPMLWGMYDKILVANLVKRGYSALQARDLVTKKAPVAKQALIEESRVRPVLINRAPTLHRWSIIAAYPKMTAGKTIRISPFAEKGMNADYDGDTVQVHAPITLPAIDDAKKMTLSNLLLSDQTKDKLLVYPAHEAMIGLTMATQHQPTTKVVRRFNSGDEVTEAWRRGELKPSDTIEIESVKSAEEEEPFVHPDNELSLLSEWPTENESD